MRLDLVTPPAVEPVSLAEAKAHARVEFADDDAIITSLIVAARRLCETEVRRSFITQTWDFQLDRFPYRMSGQVLDPWAFPSNRLWLERMAIPGNGVIEVPRPKLQSVASITYIDVQGNTQTLDPSAYRVVPGTPGVVEPAYQTTWPAVRPVSGAVTVRFVAGYGDDATAVPDCVKIAVKMLVGYLYENREPYLVSAGLTVAELPMTVRALLATEDWGSYP
jgi:uncharacterized phiE125 gp8 family phage protein